MSTVAYANENVSGPLSFQLPLLDCPTDPMGVNGGAALKLRATEMAKLGYLYLDHGCRGGKRIVVEKWVAQSTETGSDRQEMAGISRV